MMTAKDFYTARIDDLKEAAEDFIERHREYFGIEGCEDPILIAAEKLLVELKRESEN